MNKKAQERSTGFAWIVGLVLMVVMGLLFIILNQAMQSEIVPMAKNLINDSIEIPVEDRQESLDGVDHYNNYWMFLPAVLFILILIFILVGSLLS